MSDRKNKNVKEYPDKMGEFFKSQMDEKSYNNMFSLLFGHMGIWYPNYKIKVLEYKVEIRFKHRNIHTNLMEILSNIEKELQKNGYNEPSVLIDLKKKKIIIEE